MGAHTVGTDVPKDEPSPPAMPPLNGAFRFGLELGALGAMGSWGYEQLDGPGRYGLMVATPLLAGVVRLLIESTFFGFASWAVYDLGQEPLARGFGGAKVLHYTLSLDRLAWLVRQ